MYKKVTSIVISFHLLFMTFLLFNPHHAPVKRTTYVKVRTVRPVATIKKAPQPVQKAAPVQKKGAPTQSTAAPKTQPKPQSVAQKPATSNKPAVVEKGKPIKKVLPKKEEPKQEIWNEIDQALAKIEKKSYPVSKQTVDLPPLPVFLDEIGAGQEGEDDALSHLVGYLHDTLHLPEVGEVKLEITVRKNGTVAKVVVLRAESQKNKLYLQEHLPHLQFPLQFDQDKTWTITFCNEV